jgi:hypothetical protein
MADLKLAVPAVRESVAAVLRLRQLRAAKVKKGKLRPPQFQCSWGSTFCVVTDRYLLTAFHVLNAGQPRDPQDRFYAFTVPGNGGASFMFPVVAFPLERADLDIAVLEVGPCANGAAHIPGLPVSFGGHPDGTRVVTVGFPAPEVAGLNVDAQGNLQGGQFFLKSHANEGIVSARYDLGVANLPVYELNVGWHHGESGGPVATLADQPAAFSLMQHYRNIQAPHGIEPGPHRGCALSAIQQELQNLGVVGV